jgi:nicotinate-nucleotide adenylyltransferase
MSARDGLRIGVLGGTFDPPHLGHLILAEHAYDQLGLDRVAFVPAGDPWRKASRKVTAASHRLAMTRLAVENDGRFYADPIEVERSGPTYTAETLEALQRSQAGASLFFLLGADALADLPNWHDPHRITAAATLVVAPRLGDSAPLPEDVVALSMPYVGISATDIRERVRQGKGIRYLVPEAVAAYIEANGLYAD